LKNHYEGAQQFWQLCDQKGDIYKKHYEGLYCVGCPVFLLERDLVDGKCPNHGKPPVNYAEENFFFRLSKYSNAVIDYVNSTRIFSNRSRRSRSY